MNVFGLDIGSNTIKICQTEKSGNKNKLISAGLVATPAPGLVSESVSDLTALATVIKKLHRDSKITTRKVIVGLSESDIFSKVIEMPKMKESELASAIPWEAEQLIPLPLSEVVIDWQQLGEFTGSDGIEKVKIIVVASPNTLIEKYRKVVELSGLELVAIDTELIAACRALLNPQSPPTMIVDMGATSTDLAITNKGLPFYTRSLPTAGESLTRVIASSLQMELQQSEQYKIAYGLDPNQLEGKINKLLEPVFQSIILELKKAILFWNESEKEPIKSIVLYGGTANLPQATSLITAALGVEIQIADPLRLFEMPDNLRQELFDKSGLLTVAIGLSEKEE